MNEKGDGPKREASILDVVLFLLLAAILFGIMVTKNLHVTRGEGPRPPVSLPQGTSPPG
ncbi:MAG: hypothetical protein M1313_02515 [Nitrospirae bacterium]|nr:hypothetical protein [Nitrospirota bacterium]